MGKYFPVVMIEYISVRLPYENQPIMNNRLARSFMHQLQNSLNGDLWVGETFSGKLDQVDNDQAFVRPVFNVHSIAELVSHLLEWRLSVMNILRGGEPTLSMDSPMNWRDNQELKNIGWQSLLAVFNSSQQALIDLLSTQDDYFLDRIAVDGRSYEYYLEGLIHHDMYHLGQIGLVIKMLGMNKQVS
jgi:uncharacterized damage-inducible protein DinB